MTVTYNAALGGRTSLGVFTDAGAFTTLVADEAQAKKQLIVETISGTVPAVLAANFGKLHLHSHASEAPTYTLPAVTAADKGATLRFAKIGSGTITVIPPTNNTIDDSTMAVKASGYVNSDGTIPADGDTVTINTTVYTFKTTLTPTEGQVLIGGSAAVALDNLKSAINHTGVPGTAYSCAAAHATVEATTNTDTRQTVVARAYGTAANSYPLEVTDANMSVSAATMADGVAAGVLSCSDAAPASIDLMLMADGKWGTVGSSNTWAVS